MLLKSCKRCGNLIPYGEVYCSKCKPIIEAQREKRLKESKQKSNKKYNKTKRNKRDIQFYNSTAWRSLADRYKQDKQYKCEECGRFAVQVHHTIPIQIEEGWNRRLDYNNLELLCQECHNKKHNRFVKRK